MKTSTKTTVSGLKAFITSRVAAELGVPGDTIEPDVPFAEFGLDSAAMVGLSGDLAELLGRTLDATVAFDFPTIDALSAHLAAPDA